MMFLHAVVQREIQNDPIALAMVLAIVAILVVMVIRKRTQSKNQTVVAAPVPEAPEASAAPAAPGSAGQLKLYNVEPKTAAMLMAIVADKLGKPLNELRFISIKEVE